MASLAHSDAIEKFKVDVLKLVRPHFHDNFNKRFERIRPVLDEIYRIHIDWRKYKVFLAGGAAAYLIGSFNTFDGVNIYIQPCPHPRDWLQSLTHQMEVLHTVENPPHIFTKVGRFWEDPANKCFFTYTMLEKFADSDATIKIQIVITTCLYRSSITWRSAFYCRYTATT